MGRQYEQIQECRRRQGRPLTRLQYAALPEQRLGQQGQQQQHSLARCVFHLPWRPVQLRNATCPHLPMPHPRLHSACTQ
jgi:hypothetical protein